MQEFLATIAVAAEAMSSNVLIAFLFGTIGALVKDILEDGALQLPKIKEGKFYIGFVGGIIIGGVAGILTGGNMLTEFLAGFTGYSVIASLVAGKKTQNAPTNESIKETITKALEENKTVKANNDIDIKSLIIEIADSMGIDNKLALAVAEAESSFNEKATNKNTDESIDRGLYQINSKWHPQVSDKEAFDPEFSIKFFCEAVKSGNLSWWNSSKPKWIDKVYTT